MTPGGGPARLIAAVAGAKPTGRRKPRPVPTPLVQPQGVHCRVPGCGGEYEMRQDRTYGRVFEACLACERRVLEVKQLRDLVDRYRVALVNAKSEVRICPRCKRNEVPPHCRFCAACARKHASPAVRACQRCHQGEMRGHQLFCPACRDDPARPHRRLRLKPKPCARCGREFQPTGPRSQFCPTGCPTEAPSA